VANVKHFLLFLGQARLNAMQEKRCFGKQPFGRTGAFDDDTIGIFQQFIFIFAVEFTAGVNYYRNIALFAFLPDFFQQIKTRHIFKAEVEDDAIEVVFFKLINSLVSG